MSTLPMTEADLHAYVDGALPEARRAEVEAYLAARPQEAGRVQDYRQQNEALHRLFDPVIDEPVPERLETPLSVRRNFFSMRYAAAAMAWMVLGGVIGWQLGGGHLHTMVWGNSTCRRLIAALRRQQETSLRGATRKLRRPQEAGKASQNAPA